MDNKKRRKPGPKVRGEKKKVTTFSLYPRSTKKLHKIAVICGVSASSLIEMFIDKLGEVYEREEDP